MRPILLSLSGLLFLGAATGAWAQPAAVAPADPAITAARSPGLGGSDLLDLRRNKPNHPGFRAFQLETITTTPFTPLGRLTGGSLEYLVPLIQPKISGVLASGDASSFIYDGKEIYVNGTIKYPRRTDLNLSSYFSDAPADKTAGPGVGNTEGVLRVRTILAERVLFVDEAGYELPVPVRINNEDDQTEAAEQPLRVQMRSSFAVGVLSADGERVRARLPANLAPSTVVHVTTRFGEDRSFVLEEYADGVALLRVDGLPLAWPKAADASPLPKMKGWYALGARGGAEGFCLIGLPLTNQGTVVQPRDGTFDPALLAGLPVWSDGRLRGFADEKGLLLPVTDAGDKNELCIVIYSPTAPAAVSGAPAKPITSNP